MAKTAAKTSKKSTVSKTGKTTKKTKTSKKSTVGKKAYSAMTVKELKEKVEKLDLEVEGSGKGGRCIKIDFVEALEAAGGRKKSRKSKKSKSASSVKKTKKTKKPKTESDTSDSDCPTTDVSWDYDLKSFVDERRFMFDISTSPITAYGKALKTKRRPLTDAERAKLKKDGYKAAKISTAEGVERRRARVQKEYMSSDDEQDVFDSD